jgi:hypothetical protein
LGLDFTETVVPKSHVRFYHEESGTDIILTIYRSNQIVLPHHLLSIRVQLDGRGVMEADDFDDLVTSRTVQKSAS